MMSNLLQFTSAVDAYEHPKMYVLDELIVLDILLEMAMQQMHESHEAAASTNDAFRGMYVSASEAQALLDDDEPFLRLTPDQALLIEQLELRIAARVEKTSDEFGPLPIQALRRAYQLHELDIRMLMVAIAPHVNRKYLKLYGYLQDDMTCQYVTMDLMLRLCCRSVSECRYVYERLTSSDSPFKAIFAFQTQGIHPRSSSLLTDPLSLDPRIISFLLGIEWRYDGALASLKHYPVIPHESLPPLLIHDDIQQQMLHFMRKLDAERKNIFWMLQGPTGSGKTLHARHVGISMNKALLEFDVSLAPEEMFAFKHTIEQFLREARLLDAIPALDGLQQLTAAAVSGRSDDRRLHWLLEILSEWSGVVFLFSLHPVKLDLTKSRITWLPIAIPWPDLVQSQQLWLHYASPYWRIQAQEASHLAAKFTFTPGQIEATIENARKLEAWRDFAQSADSSAFSCITLLHDAAYQLIHHQLQNKAAKVETRMSWDDLILPDETIHLLRQACDRLKHRQTVMHDWGFDRLLPYGRGISMMFTGPPGTGKTMSAHVMAKEMGTELYRVDLSRIVSKYIGETEKNLSEVFDQARLSGAILFFDEADALFGKRSEVKDAHDKYANMETSYLLQKMEEYDGLTILATNFAQNLDDAFTRRIQYIVRFLFPDAIQREQIWRSSIPPQMPTEEIDYPFLAQAFELSGGPIKNIILTAAYLAAHEGTSLTMKHVVESAMQEYKKSGKLLLKDRMGPYAAYWKG